MTIVTMGTRNVVNIHQPEAKEEGMDKSSFREILSTAMDKTSSEKKEAKSEKDMEVIEETSENGEEASMLNLLPLTKTELQETALGTHKLMNAQIVEEAENAVDQSQPEKDLLNELLSGKQGERISLKEHTGERDPRLIDIPKDQGKTELHDQTVPKETKENPDVFTETLRKIPLYEKSEMLPDYKPSEVTDEIGKPEYDAEKTAVTVKPLKEMKASGVGQELNVKLEEIRELEKGSMNLEGMEPVKEAVTSSEEPGKGTETVNPMHEIKLRDFQEVSQTKRPESINFEKTFENAAEEIMKNVETIRDGDRTTMKVNLHPDEMGKMEITLTMEDGKLSGKILLENREIRQIFTERLEELSNSLKQNIQIGKFEVSVGDRGEGSQERHQGQRQMQNPFRGYQLRKTETPDYEMNVAERNLVEINLLA
jgi:flagellar hook-length control protein FliK